MFDRYRRIAVAVMLVGATVAIGPSLGGVVVDANRSTTVDVVSDPDAILGIDAKSDIGQLKASDGEVEVATITNGIGETATVSVRVVDIPEADDGILSADPDGLDVADGDSVSATVQCEQAKSPGERDVVFGARAVGSRVSVRDATFTVTINIKCKSGQIESTDSGLAAVDATNLTDGDPSQPQAVAFQVTEDLTAGESVTVTVVDGAKNERVSYTDATFTTDAPGSLSGRVSKNDHVVTFTADETIVKGATIRIDAAGVDASGQQAGKKSPYTVDFERSDYGNAESTEFSVT